MGLTGKDEFVFDVSGVFQYMQVWWLFPVIFLVEYMQVWCTFGIKMFIFFEYMQVWWTSSPSNLQILKKTKIKNFRLYVGLTGIDEFVFVFIFLSIRRFGDASLWFFWFFWVYAGVWCWSFLSICRFCALLVVKTMHFWLIMQVFERYK